jgi:hypothetical protein
MPFIVTAPYNYPLVHYHRDAFNFQITVLDAAGDPFDFTGYTGRFYIRNSKSSDDSELDFEVTFQDNSIFITQDIDDYSVLTTKTYFYELILTDSNGDPKAWIAGKYEFTNKPQSSQGNAVTIQFNNYTLTITLATNTLSYVKSAFKRGIALTGTKNGINTSFTIPVTAGRSLVAGTEEIFYAGRIRERNVGYTISDATVTLSVAPGASDSLIASWMEE